MGRRLVECVPNFSEGRNAETVQAIAAAVSAVPGVLLLDVERDADHHRSVVTFAAPESVVVDAALAAAQVAVARIDLTRHAGVHPRIGALDVLPFVPLGEVTLEECVILARSAAARLWAECGVPSYFYEAAAVVPERQNLADVRKGQFEGLCQEALLGSHRAPDVGGPALHPTAGATAVGARKFLVAYNINLDTPDVGIAKQIARRIRTSGGGLPCLKALGVLLGSRNLAQVTMNLTDFTVTPVKTVWDLVNAEARALGVGVLESELIGLMPRDALAGTSPEEIRLTGFRESMILENRIAEVTAAISSR